MKGWKFTKTKNKSIFGETDYEKKKISVNKTKSKQASKLKKGHWDKYGMSKKETSVINTLVHEKIHAQHPKMLEDGVRMLAKAMVSKMSKKQKGRLYSKIN